MVSKNTKHDVDTDAALENRRKSVKRLLSTGGLVAGGHLTYGAWAKPLVDTVILPAHAVTSADIRFDDSLGDPCFITLTCTTYEMFNIQVDGAVVPATQGVAVDIEIAFDGSGSFSSFASTTTDANGEYQESSVYSGAHFSVQIRVTLPDYPDAGTAECSIDINSEGSLNPGSGYETGAYFCNEFLPGP